MTGRTGIAFLLAAAAHAGVLYSVRIPVTPASQEQTVMEVELAAPPEALPAEELPPLPIPPAQEPLAEPELPEPQATPEVAPEITPEPKPEPKPELPAPEKIAGKALVRVEKKKAVESKPRIQTIPPAVKKPAGDPLPGRSGEPASGKTRPIPNAKPGYQSVGTVSYLSRPEPVYPPECLRKKQTGTVMILLFINEAGKVDRVEIEKSSGIPALDRAASSAARRSRFRPVVSGGTAVKARARVPYTFTLKQ